MPGERENIISRLFDVVNGVSGFTTKARNRINFNDTQLPAISVLEGDEEVAEDNDRGRPPLRPYRVTATPQLFIRVGQGSGSEMNNLIEAVIAAVLGDATLCAMSLNGRGISYSGMASTLHVGRWNDMASAALTFRITYILNPS